MSLTTVRKEGYEMCDENGTIYMGYYYLIGDPRKALRRQIALAGLFKKPDGDQWWLGRPSFEPIKTIKDDSEIITFLQEQVNTDMEHMLKRIESAAAKA